MNDRTDALLGTSGECFVVMPFGKKPLPDGSAYDFDKVYRVIITRAVQEAGMKPLRADETVGSRLIHSDMFKDLRDRAVVLADLSLENPNVFYELGIRHVMASSGTVLMCRKGTDLPFDVRLSRVVFYKFDGDDLDWEEVEETVKTLKLALQDAQQQQPDSPVHVLLENVMKSEASQWLSGPASADSGENLEKYHRSLAQQWKQSGIALSALLPEHHDSVFGLRALGHYCLLAQPLPAGANEVAGRLSDAEQYDFAAEIYARLQADGLLTNDDLLRFATAYSESHPDLRGANTAIGYVQQALADESKALAESEDQDGLRSARVAHCYRRLGGLLQWKWLLTKADGDLAVAIDALNDALVHMTRARTLGKFPSPGLIAQARLKLLLALRTRDRNASRPDRERHLDAIRNLLPMPNDSAVGLSYLHWFQAIALADQGAEDDANSKALDQLAEDRKLMMQPGSFEIGRRQYILLRRFLESFRDVLRNPRIMGRISRHLLVGLRKSS